MTDSPLDPILAALTYENMEWLRSFHHDRSFKEVAARFGRDERTISQQLLRLNQAFWDRKQIHILDREGRTYHLTKAGEAFVNHLEDVTQRTRIAIDGAAAATRHVPILCSSNCFTRLRELSDALRNASFSITPVNRRSAEIDLNFTEGSPDRDIRVGVCSALMSSAQGPAVGAVTQWNDRVEVLPLQIDQFRLLCTGDLGIRGPVTARGLIGEGIVFLMPRGGVVWDFFNREYPGWWRLRPFQHVPVVDRDAGLNCLASGLPGRYAMVVHGVGQEALEPYGLSRALMYDFADDGIDHLMAAIGVFHVRQHDIGDQEDPYELIWKTAQSLWVGKESPL
jgi:DNA-binding transcriptional LysR family regulator